MGLSRTVSEINKNFGRKTVLLTDLCMVMTLGKVMICIFIISRNQLAKELFSILEVFCGILCHQFLRNACLKHLKVNAPCGLRGCKNGPAPFPGPMSYKATKPVLVCQSYHGMLYYYAALLPRRRPHIASHSVCPSRYHRASRRAT